MPDYRFRLARTPIAVGVLGQSNERGQTDPAELIGGVASLTAYPQAYASLRNPALRYPIGPATAKNGGMWFRLYDELFDWGYDARIANGAVGSASMIRDIAGQCQARANSTGYRQRRAPGGQGDNGYAGDFMVVQGRVFLCTKGLLAFATNLNSDYTQVSGATSSPELDYIRTIGTNATAAAEPAGLATAAVGDVVVDGTIEWTCLSTSTSYGNYSYTAGGVFNDVRVGFDPFGLCRRLLREVQAVRDARYRVVLLANAQSDTASLAYQQALESIGQYYAHRGVAVAIGLSCWQPTGGSISNYDNLSIRVAGAITNLRAQATSYYRAADILTGANLYQLMGSTGDMAAGGANFAKDSGQDGIHLNARGNIIGGGYWAAALKTWLPQIVDPAMAA